MNSNSIRRDQHDSPHYADPDRICRNLRDILLKRGWPCHQNYLTIQLLPGLHEKDYSYLKRTVGRHALPNRIKANLVDGQPLIKIADVDGTVLYRFQTLSAELFIYSRAPRLLRESREISYMTGPPVMGDISSLRAFERTAYGVKVPVQNLEGGIALLTKCLGFVSILSSMSCAGGHWRENRLSAPRIWLPGGYNTFWMKNVFEEQFSDYSIAKTWSFTCYANPASVCKRGFDPAWASGVFQAHPDWKDNSRESRQEYRRVIDDIQAIAKRLLDPDLTAFYRAQKNEWARDFHKRHVKQDELALDLERQTDRRIAG